MSEIVQIARSLTKAQREALTTGVSCGGGPDMERLRLWKRVTPEHANDYDLTPLGKQVRALLAKEQPE